MKHPVLKASLLVCLLLAGTACDKKSSAAPAAGITQTAAKTRVIDVEVGDSGFKPSSISLSKGEKSTLRFTRVSDQTCAKRVVFPELKVEKDLPLNQAVEIPVPTDTTRRISFQCGMGMYAAAVVVN